MKKINLALIGLASVGALAGCTGHKKGGDYDATKTNIRVEYFNGGYGSEFIKKAAAKFEEKYKDYKNGNLVGVKIIPVPSRNTGVNIADAYASLTTDVVFTEMMTNYYDLVRTGKVLEITDIIKEQIPEQGHSIYDVMDSSPKESYNYSDIDGDHYYALPWGTSFVGMVYDENFFFNKGLFISDYYDLNYDQPGFVFANSIIGEITTKNPAGDYATLMTDASGSYYLTNPDGDGNQYKLCKGPDGKYGTSDDGMPDTYETFFKLCNFMKNINIYPFISYGKGSGYIDWFLDGLFTDYEGKQQTELNFNFNGEATNLISVDNAGNVTKLPNVTMNPNSKGDNLEITKSAGRYYALKFYEQMCRGDNWMHPDMISSVDQYTAQLDFMDCLRAGSRKAAFLIDGDWWQNEAITAGSFKTLEAYGDQYKLENRRFKLFSLPKANRDKIGEDRVTMDVDYKGAFILAKIDQSKIDIAKKFLQFCFTDESNKEFTLTTGSTRPYQYTLSETEKESMTCFGKSVWEATKSSNAKVANPISKSPYYLDKCNIIDPSRFFFTKINGLEQENIVEVIKNQGKSAEVAFNGIYEYFRNRY